MTKKNQSLIGVDLGGTKVAVGKITGGILKQQVGAKINQDSEDPMDAVRLMIDLIGELMDDQVLGIGVGVPGLVNRELGIVYDVLNIPNWKETPGRQGRLYAMACGLCIDSRTIFPGRVGMHFVWTNTQDRQTHFSPHH